MGEVHLWTLRNQTLVPDRNTGIFTYHEKNDPGSEGEHIYWEEKLQYTESRDATWTPKNKRPERLRDTLKEVEDTLATYRILRSKWLTRQYVQLYLANGSVVSLVVSLHTGDIDRILFDKTLVGKLSGENPTDVLITDQYLVYAYPDRPKLDFVCFTKRPPIDSVRKLEKISSYEPKISQTELPGPVGRKLKRQLVNNMHCDQVITWWPTASEEAWPWSPMTGDRERANLVLLVVNQTRLDIVTYTRTESDPLCISFSMCQPHLIQTIEQAPAGGGEVMTDICTYDSTRSKVMRQTVTSMTLKSRVICQSRNANEDRLLLSCEDGSLVLFDENNKLTQMTTAAFVASSVIWHPSGTVFVAGSRKGELQVFDMALSSLFFQLVTDNPGPKPTLELAHYFRSPPLLDCLKWSPVVENQEVIAECTDCLLLVFDRGPVGVLQLQLGVISQGHLGPLHLLNQYIKHQQLDEAVNLLGAQNWHTEGQLCYACLSTIVTHLLKQPLNPDREAQLEAALGTFYAPAKPLSEVTVLEYRDPISRLARRFFHQLLRFSRFDKAFLLAVDIGSRDLFMDIHYLARDKGETALAEVARQKADQIETESIGSESVDGYEEGSSEEIEEDYGEDYYDELSEEEVHERRHPPAPGPPLPPRHVAAAQMDSVMKMPPSPMYVIPPSDIRFIPQRQRPAPQPSTYNRHQHYSRYPEAALQELEDELSSQMFTEYTAALLDEIPPPQLPSEEDSQAQPRAGSGDHTYQNVKVVHFGIV